MGREEVMRGLLEQRAQYRDRLRSQPVLRYLFFEVTDRCNLSCLHCGSSCTMGSGRDMLPEYMERTLRSVVAHVPPEQVMLCVTGGEPLLYPQLLEVVERASKAGFRWGMTTNGTLIDDSKARALYQAGLVSATISIDGIGASHDWFRNSPGSFQRAERGLQAMVRNAPDGTRVDILTVANKRNLHELEDIHRFAVDSGVRSWRIVNMEPIGRAVDNEAYMLSDDELVHLLNYIQEKHLSSRDIDIDYGCSHYLTPRYERMLRPYCFACMAGLQVASIACNGDIIACLDIQRRPELVQGNVETDDFWQVWTEGYGYFRKDRTQDSGQCRDCPDRDLCGGDSAHTWDFDGKKPYLCVRELLERKQQKGV